MVNFNVKINPNFVYIQSTITLKKCFIADNFSLFYFLVPHQAFFTNPVKTITSGTWEIGTTRSSLYIITPAGQNYSAHCGGRRSDGHSNKTWRTSTHCTFKQYGLASYASLCLQDTVTVEPALTVHNYQTLPSDNYEHIFFRMENSIAILGSDSEEEMSTKREYIDALKMVHQLDG